jgi:hypothetical protein
MSKIDGMTRRSIYVAVASVILLAASLSILYARGRREVALEGIVQWSFEESAFYKDGDCSIRPWWFNESDAGPILQKGLGKRWDSLGKPAAIHIKFSGNVSWLGRYGHLGKYSREVLPISIEEVSRASRCPRAKP